MCHGSWSWFSAFAGNKTPASEKFPNPKKREVCFRKCACTAPKTNVARISREHGNIQFDILYAWNWLSVHRILRNSMELNRWFFKCSFDSIAIFAVSNGKSGEGGGDDKKLNATNDTSKKSKMNINCLMNLGKCPKNKYVASRISITN